MNERTWRCTECRHFVFPNYCAVKEINVDRNYDGYCDLAEELEELKAPDGCAGCYREKTCELWRNELLRDEIIKNGCDLYDQNRPTNFDQLTNSPEVLAGFLASIAFDAGCDECPADTGKCDVKTCQDTWLEWLNKEVEK